MHKWTKEFIIITEPVFLQYANKRPIPNNGNGTPIVPQGTVDGCGVLARIFSTGKSFGIHHFEHNNTHDVTVQDCHVFDKTLLQYEDLGEMGEAEDFAFYDPLEINPDLNVDNRGMCHL